MKLFPEICENLTLVERLYLNEIVVYLTTSYDDMDVWLKKLMRWID